MGRGVSFLPSLYIQIHFYYRSAPNQALNIPALSLKFSRFDKTVLSKNRNPHRHGARKHLHVNTIGSFCGRNIIDAVTLAKPLPQPAKRKS